jgi:hypothetical protein
MLEQGTYIEELKVAVWMRAVTELGGKVAGMFLGELMGFSLDRSGEIILREERA